MKISDRNTVQIRSYILNFIIVWPGYDNIGSATRLDKIVIDAALDHLSQAQCPELDIAGSGQADKS